jgi:transcription elongation factor GreB
VAFGARVTLDSASGEQVAYEIVGPDEVDVAAGRISIASPVGRALLGKRAGDVVVLRRPRGDVEVTVVSVAVPAG